MHEAPLTPAPVPQNDPKASYLAQRAEIDAAIAQVMEGGWYILGQRTTAFEKAFAAAMGAEEAVGVANGTDAIMVALRAVGVKPGMRVATVAHTAVATAAAVEAIGAVPVLIDIDPKSYTMAPEALEAALKQARAAGDPIRAVLPVHLYGHAADLDILLPLAREYECKLIEDCAQAHGCELNGKRIGGIGDAASFSFYPTKNLGAFGDGGAVVTNDPAAAAECRALREYGWRGRRYISETVGANSRLDELQAAILHVKLSAMDADNQRRRDIAARYDAALAGNPFVSAPSVDPRCRHVYHQYVVETGARDAFQAALKEAGVTTAIHYPVPVHLQPAYEGRIAIGPAGMAVTERAAKRVCSLPMFPQLTTEQVDRVIAAITQWSEAGERTAKAS